MNSTSTLELVELDVDLESEIPCEIKASEFAHCHGTDDHAADVRIVDVCPSCGDSCALNCCYPVLEYDAAWVAKSGGLTCSACGYYSPAVMWKIVKVFRPR